MVKSYCVMYDNSKRSAASQRGWPSLRGANPHRCMAREGVYFTNNKTLQQWKKAQMFVRWEVVRYNI